MKKDEEGSRARRRSVNACAGRTRSERSDEAVDEVCRLLDAGFVDGVERRASLFGNGRRARRGYLWRRALRTTETLAGDQSGSKDVGSHNLRGDPRRVASHACDWMNAFTWVILDQSNCHKSHSIFPSPHNIRRMGTGESNHAD